MLIALAGCTTDNTRATAPPAYGPAPAPAQPRYDEQEIRPYAYNQPQAQQAPQPAVEPAPDYREQAPAYDPSAQDAPPTSIRNVEDFQEPLREHGQWLDTPEYGRVWQPYDQPNDWRPYSSDGQWAYTSWGWTWQSSQPWGWAAYHYGNWVFMPRCGWVWSPGVVWSPAWVVWRECDDYVAWAPAPPARFQFYYSSSDYCDPGVRYCDYVVVPRRRFCEPIHRGVVVAPEQNIKIVNKTKNVTKTKFVNKGVINYGPSIAGVEAATGQRVQARKVADVIVPPERLSKQAPKEASQQQDEKQSKAIRLHSEPASKKQVAKTQTLVNVAPSSQVSPAVEPRKPAREERISRQGTERIERKAEQQKEKIVGPPSALPARSEIGSRKDNATSYSPPPVPKLAVRPALDEPKPRAVARPNTNNDSRNTDRKYEQPPRREQSPHSQQVTDSSRRKGPDRIAQLTQAEPKRDDRVQDRDARTAKPNREQPSASPERASRKSNEDQAKQWRDAWIPAEAALRDRR
jgi:hypothetical protein